MSKAIFLGKADRESLAGNRESLFQESLFGKRESRSEKLESLFQESLSGFSLEGGDFGFDFGDHATVPGNQRAQPDQSMISFGAA